MSLARVVVYGIVLTSLAMVVAGRSQGSQGWIPFQTPSETALPVVEARLNGRDGQPMVLDFTIQEVMLDTLLVVGTGMKLVSRGEKAAIEYYGRNEEVEVVYLDTLEVGGVGRQGVRTLLIEGGDDIGVRDGLRAYGRIGLDFLEAFRLTVHYPRKLLLLEPSPEYDVPAGGAQFEKLGRIIAVDVVVNGDIPARFVIDPSASVTAIDKTWAVRNGLAEKKDRNILLSSLRVGGFTAEQVQALLGEMKKMPYGEKPLGVLGASLLRGLAVTYDFPRDLVWLRHVEGGESS